MRSRDEARGGGTGILAVAGCLPVAVAATGFASGLYLGAAILAVSLFLHACFLITGRIIKRGGYRLRISFLVAGSLFIALLKFCLSALDPGVAPDAFMAMDMILLCTLMRSGAEGWEEDLERRAIPSVARLKAPALASLFVVLAGLARDAFGSGRLTLPLMEGRSVALPPETALPSAVIASPAGLLLVAGFTAAGLKALASAIRGRRQ